MYNVHMYVNVNVPPNYFDAKRICRKIVLLSIYNSTLATIKRI